MFKRIKFGNARNILAVNNVTCGGCGGITPQAYFNRGGKTRVRIKCPVCNVLIGGVK